MFVKMFQNFHGKQKLYFILKIIIMFINNNLIFVVTYFVAFMKTIQKIFSKVDTFNILSLAPRL